MVIHVCDISTFTHTFPRAAYSRRRYNEAQTFGVLKRMFPCYIMVVCVVLYNIATAHSDLIEFLELKAAAEEKHFSDLGLLQGDKPWYIYIFTYQSKRDNRNLRCS